VGAARKKYTTEYKAEAVDLVLGSGRPVAEIARELGILPSAGKTGICFDNAAAESFNALYKKELIHLAAWRDLRAEKSDLPQPAVDPFLPVTTRGSQCTPSTLDRANVTCHGTGCQIRHSPNPGRSSRIAAGSEAGSIGSSSPADPFSATGVVPR
jgi:hypothetical protein